LCEIAAEDRADLVLEVRAGILRILLKQAVDLLLEGVFQRRLYIILGRDILGRSRFAVIVHATIFLQNCPPETK
jgi:hypothetical protein